MTFDLNWRDNYKIMKRKIAVGDLTEVIQWNSFFLKNYWIRWIKLCENPNTLLSFLNIDKDDKHCFLWSLLANLHPCGETNPDRVSSYTQQINELNIVAIRFSNGFRCSGVYKLEKLKSFFISFFELSFFKME